MKQLRSKFPDEWPAPIDDTIKKKCLLKFVQKMSKKERFFVLQCQQEIYRPVLL